MKHFWSFRKILVVLVLILIGAFVTSHIWFRSKRFTVTEGGKLVTNAEVYRWIGGGIYVTLPEWKNEAYIVDSRDKAVFVPMANQTLLNGVFLLSTHWRINAVYFGKLEREMPQFSDGSVSFISNNGTHITVRERLAPMY
jgi:hypothetical protein